VLLTKRYDKFIGTVINFIVKFFFSIVKFLSSSFVLLPITVNKDDYIAVL